MVVHCCECGNLVSDRADTCPFCGFDMRLPVTGEQKKRNALRKLWRSQAWVAGAILLTVLSALFSARLIHSARSLQEAQVTLPQRPTDPMKPADPRRKEIEELNSNYQSTVTLAILLGLGDIALLTWAIRRYRWHNYLYQKEFGRSRRKSSYTAAYPGASSGGKKS